VKNVFAALPVFVALNLFEAILFAFLTVCLEFALRLCLFLFLEGVLIVSLLPG